MIYVGVCAVYVCIYGHTVQYIHVSDGTADVVVVVYVNIVT